MPTTDPAPMSVRDLIAELERIPDAKRDLAVQVHVLVRDRHDLEELISGLDPDLRAESVMFTIIDRVEPLPMMLPELPPCDPDLFVIFTRPGVSTAFEVSAQKMFQQFLDERDAGDAGA